MATITKSTVKHTYPSWFTQLHAQSKAAVDVRNDSSKLRNLTKVARIQTDSKTKFDQYDSSNRLADGVTTLRQWIDLLRRQVERLKDRMGALSEAKRITEEFLVKLADAQHVNVESLTYLDHRRLGEYIVDPVEDELRSENDLLEELYKDLQSQILEAFEAQLRLQDIAARIQQDLDHKTEALKVDIDQYNLNEKSGNVSFKPFATRVRETRTDIQTWEDRARDLMDRANEELERAADTIHRLHLGIHQAANRMGAKADRVMDAVRLRLHDTERAIRELEYQREMTEREREKLHQELKNLKEARKAKLASLKLAQTRLEGRQDKPLEDDVHDAAHEGLIGELDSINESIDALDTQIEKTNDMLARLETELARLCQDIRMKKETLQIYQSVINFRKMLETPPHTRYPYCPMIPSGIVREPKKFYS